MLLLRGHPNIIKFYGFFADDEYIYIAMVVLGAWCDVQELAPGGRLFDYIKQRQQFMESDARLITRCLVSAVAYCHAHSIVHRDLKPQNILLVECVSWHTVTYSGSDLASLKLTDFGFSSSMHNGLLKTSLGTPGYTAPEVLRHKEYNASVDMWSIGVITYILWASRGGVRYRLCGYPPFPSNNDAERLRAISTAEYRFYPAEWDCVSEEAKMFIRSLLVVDPSKRLTAAQVGVGWRVFRSAWSTRG